MTEGESVQAVIDLALTVGSASTAQADGIPYTIVPHGAQLRLLEDTLPTPTAVRATVNMGDLVSFVRYINTYGDEEATQVFASVNEKGASFQAILDYHRKNPLSDTVEPSWCRHRALYLCPQTPEWKRWQASSGKTMDQQEFAEFIEDSERDLVKPTGAEMLEIALTLQAKTNVEFASAVRLQNGNVQLRYQENTTATAGATGQLLVPEKITIGVALFEGGPRYAIEARLRYRLTGGKLSFVYQLINPHLVVKDAFDEMCKVVESETKLKPFLGGASQ
jgi:uncharacterized protein YfdQ (DUF2303 family)